LRLSIFCAIILSRDSSSLLLTKIWRRAEKYRKY
jgi:hypothetical protein